MEEENIFLWIVSTEKGTKIIRTAQNHAPNIIFVSVKLSKMKTFSSQLLLLKTE